MSVRRWGPRVAGVAGTALAVFSALFLDLFVELIREHGLLALALTVTLSVIAVSAWWLSRQQVSETSPETPTERPGPPPETLPPDISGFVGRQAQLDEVVKLADREPVIAAVGERGVGTSAFVLHTAHLLRPRFPDGHVYVDVRGSERRRLKPGQVLDRVCRRLELPPPRSWKPSDLDAASEKLRSLLAHKHVLLVLDNVDDPDQVALVLPNSANSLALLAKSNTLMDLDAMHRVNIGELSIDEAVELLVRAADRELTDGDVRSARELVPLLADQPLQIRLLGQQLVEYGLTVEEVRQQMEKLAAQPRYEHEPDAPALRKLWDTCDLTYQGLSADQQRMFRLLGLVPATEIGVSAAAALAGLRVKPASRVMEALAARGLLEVETHGRYRLRKLLAGSARLHLRSETPAHRQRALLRLTRHLARIATEHAGALQPAVRHRVVEREAARAAAYDWFISEHDLLFRLVTNWHSEETAEDEGTTPVEQPPEPVQAWLHRMAVALCVWYAEEHRLTQWQDVCEAVLAMPIARAEPSIAAWAHNELGAVYRQQGDPLAACDALTRALQHSPLRRQPLAAQIQANLGLAWLDRLAWHDGAESREAMLHIDRARWLSSEPYEQAIQHLALSGIYLHLRDHEAALHHTERSLDLFDELDEPRGLAAALNNLGLGLWLRGDHADAEEYWEQAADRYTTLTDSAGIARVRLNTAAMLLAVDPARTDEAVALLEESLQWRAGSPETLGTGLCHLHLGDAYAQNRDLGTACEEWSLARKIFDELGAMTVHQEAVRRLVQHGCQG
ncbi:MAG TPA: tetratricopeptide repeat protein [Micromonosporaceae bacterium]|nr:tetratricopeptide repeat protein [Micromonosporaceae bacterium]